MRIAGYFLIIVIPLLIILGNFHLLILNFNLYQNLYQKTGVYQTFADREIVNWATDNLFGYFRGKNELDHIFFSKQAILHLADVKNLLQFESGFFYLSAVAIAVISSIFVVRKQYKRLLSAFFSSSIVTIFAICLLAFGLIWDFEPIFARFHILLFKNELWLFPAHDNLVKLFPQQFFILFANSLAVNIIVTCAVIALISAVFVKKRLK